MEPYRIETVETSAGEYTIELYPDYDAPNPLEDYDHEGMGIYVTGRDPLDVLGDVPGANALRTWLRDGQSMGGVEQRYRLFRAMFGGWTLTTGNGWGSVQGEFWDWYVLTDDQWADPAKAAKGTMDDYQKWAQGGYLGYVVKAPNGSTVDSLWNIDDEDYAVQEAGEAIECDVQKRLATANLVGAGFVGIV